MDDMTVKWNKSYMGSIENFTQRLALELKTRGLKPVPFSLKIGTNPTLVIDILSGKSKQPRIESRRKIADALGLTVEEMEQPPSEFEGGSIQDIAVEGGTASIQAPAHFQAEGWAGIDLLVTYQTNHGAAKLGTLSRIGNMMVLYPTSVDGSKGAPMPYRPTGAWYNGTVETEGHTHSAHISGVVRFLTIPCNSGIGAA